MGKDTVSELKELFGISGRKEKKASSAKDFAVVLANASAGKALRGDDFLHLLSGYVQANLSELRSGLLRLSLNTPCLSYLSSLVKQSQSKRTSGQASHATGGMPENRRIVLKLAVMLLDLAHLKIMSMKKQYNGRANVEQSKPVALKIPCKLNMFANLRMLEIHGTELHDLAGLAYLRDRLEGLYVEGSNITCPGMVLFEPDKIPNPPDDSERPTLSDMLSFHDTAYIWPRLEKIKFCNCGMTLLDRSLAFLPRGRVFDFSYNELEASSLTALALIAQSAMLTTVDLAFNRLSSCISLPSYLPRNMGSQFQPSLQSLNLRHNRLSTTKGLEILINLQRLDLSHNILTSLDELITLQRLRQLRSLVLEGNPIALLPNYRHSVEDALVSEKGNVESEFKFLLDGQAITVYAGGTNLVHAPLESSGRKACEHRSPFRGTSEQPSSHNSKHGRIDSSSHADDAIRWRNEKLDERIEKVGRHVREKSKHKKVKKHKRLATIEDPSALAVPVSPPRRRMAGKKVIENQNWNTEDGKMPSMEKLGRSEKKVGNNADNSRKMTTVINEANTWDQMEEYKLQVEKKMAQYQNVLKQKRQAEGANWLESDTRKVAAPLLQNASDGTAITEKVAKVDISAMKPDNAEVAYKSPVPRSTNFLKEHRENRNGDTTVGDLLYQREYLAERHEMLDSDRSSQQKLSVKTCIILVEGASFVEVDVATGNTGNQRSLDDLVAVELTKGLRGDTLLHLTFQDADTSRKEELYFVLRQAGTLDELQSLLKARVLYNVARNPRPITSTNSFNNNRRPMYRVQSKTTVQCLSCEFVFEWSYSKNESFSCERCGTSNLRTTNQALSLSRKKHTMIHARSDVRETFDKASSSAKSSDVASATSENDSSDMEGVRKMGTGNSTMMGYVDWEYFKEETPKDDPGAVGLLKQMIDEKIQARSTATRTGESREGQGGTGKAGGEYIGRAIKTRAESVYDPHEKLIVHDNFETYFRERVFCSRAKTNERVVYLVQSKCIVSKTPGGRSIGAEAANELDVIVVFTDMYLYIVQRPSGHLGTFADNPEFPTLVRFPLDGILKISIGFWAQRLRIQTPGSKAYILLTRDRERTYSLLQRFPSSCEIINEDQHTLGILQQHVLNDPTANITLFLMLYRRHKDKKRVMPRTLVLTNLGIYLCEEDLVDVWSAEDAPFRVERYAALPDILGIEQSENPTDFTVICSEKFGIISRKRRWRLRVHSRQAKARVLLELGKLMKLVK